MSLYVDIPPTYYCEEIKMDGKILSRSLLLTSKRTRETL
jgi:hypothetical protein